MPIGLMVMYWDIRSGMELLAKFPEDLPFTKETLMQVYLSHSFSRENGVTSMQTSDIAISSYHETEGDLFVIVLLKLTDDPSKYEQKLMEISKKIIQNFEHDAYIEMIPSLFVQFFSVPEFIDKDHLTSSYPGEKEIIKLVKKEEKKDMKIIKKGIKKLKK